MKTRQRTSRTSRVSSQRLGATVQIQQASRREAELLRNRGMLEAVYEVEFLFPEDRFAERGMVICGGAAFGCGQLSGAQSGVSFS